MDAFARSSPKDRLDIINEAARRRGLTPVIMEKDFWVCWTLKRLTEHEHLGPHLTFKGGTSLSKAYGIIERFSEDIDLTIGRTAPIVADTDPPMEGGLSNKKRELRINALVEAAGSYVQDVALPALAEVIEAALGTNQGWALTVDGNDPQTLLFHYPRQLQYDRQEGGSVLGASALGEAPLADPGILIPGYIRPQIKLEFGARGEPDPHEDRAISPYIADVFPEIIPNAQVVIHTLAAERTFWEKATILHALHHTGKIRDRLSRHYYDLYMMAKTGVAKIAIASPELLAQVVRNKSVMFREPKASYGSAIYGSFRLLPTDEGMQELRKDYAAMTEMFMGDPPDFEAVLATLGEIETAINTTRPQ